MRLQQPRGAYSPVNENERNRSLEAADRENHKRGQDIEVGEGRLFLTDDTTNVRYEVYMTSGTLSVRTV